MNPIFSSVHNSGCWCHHCDAVVHARSPLHLQRSVRAVRSQRTGDCGHTTRQPVETVHSGKRRKHFLYIVHIQLEVN